MMYDICYISTPTLLVQFGRVVQHRQRYASDNVSDGCHAQHVVIEMVWRASPSILWSGGELVKRAVMSDEAEVGRIT